jgi:tetratricopeptide (TPR) repeat protein
MEMGRHKEAEYYCLDALRVWKLYGSERIKEQAKTLAVLALIYHYTGQIAKALNTGMLSTDLSLKINGEMSVDHASALNTLAMIYQGVGRYKDAEDIFIKSMNIRKKLLGENHWHYTTSLNNLASLYLEEGVYEKAEPLYILAKDTRKKILGENSMPYAVSLANLGYLFNPGILWAGYWESNILIMLSVYLILLQFINTQLITKKQKSFAYREWILFARQLVKTIYFILMALTAFPLSITK